MLTLEVTLLLFNQLTAWTVLEFLSPFTELATF